MEKVYQKAIKAFGYKHTYLKTLEELLELSLDIIHYQEGKKSLSSLIGEIADVELTVEKLKLMLKETTGQEINVLVAEMKASKIENLDKVADYELERQRGRRK